MREMKKNGSAYILALPYFLLFLIFTGIPVVISLPVGFTNPIAKIVQTRAETNLFGYAECSLFSHFCKDSTNEGQKNHLVMPNVAHLRAYANVHKSFNRNYKNPENRVLA